MRKLLSILVLLVLVVAGGGYGWLWYRTHQSVEQAVATAAPFARIEYDRVYVWPRGEVGVQGLRMTPNGLGETFTAESLGMRAENLLELMRMVRGLGENRSPDRLTVVVRGASVPLDGPVGQMLSQAAAGEGLSAWGERIEALACGDHQRLGPQELMAMGYRQLTTDFSVGWDMERAEQRMRIEMEMEVRGMFAASGDAVMSLNKDLYNLQDAAGLSPKLSKAAFNYRDLGYNRRRGDFCAEAARVEPAVYRERHLAQARQAFAEAGVTLPPQLLQAYAAVAEEGGSLSITFEPSQPIDPQTLAFYKPGDVLRLLQPTLYVNGDAVSMQGLRFGEQPLSRPRPAPAQPAPVVRQAKAEAPAAPATSEAQAPQRPSFKPTEVARLGGYIGHSARLRLDGGLQREGILESVDGKSLLITRRVGGGEMTYPVKLAEIETAEVWR